MLALAHGPEHALELDLVVVRADVPSPVHVEVTGGDGRAIALEGGKLAHDPLAEQACPRRRLHETRMCWTRCRSGAPGGPWGRACCWAWPAAWATTDAMATAWAGSFTTSSAMSSMARAAAMSSRAAACRCWTTSWACSSYSAVTQDLLRRR